MLKAHFNIQSRTNTINNMSTLKNILLYISFLFFAHHLSAQDWKEMMYDPQVNIYEVVKETELYFQKVDKSAKGSGWKNYQRWLFENEAKYYPSGDRSNVDPYFVSKNYKEFLKNIIYKINHFHKIMLNN